MVARGIPGVKKRQVGNKSVEELQRLLRERAQQTSTTPSSLPKGTILDFGEESRRRTGVPADTRSRSARGTLPPNSANVPKTTKPAPNTYEARGKTYIANPNDSKKIFLKNHPVLAGLKTTDSKAKFLAAHPRIANRAAEVTNPKGPALKAVRNNLKSPPQWDKSALLRRFRKRYKLGR